MLVLPLPSGALQPHQSGVRFGKCHASRKVNAALLPGGIVRCWQRAAIALKGSGSEPNSPAAEKASQNNIGEFHQRPLGQPRQYVMLVPEAGNAPRVKLPFIGSAAAS